MAHHRPSLPEYTYTTFTHDPPPATRSPLTGRNPDFLNGLLPFYDPPDSPDRADYEDFYDAYRRTTPPPTTFLDTILNPAVLAHNRFSPSTAAMPPTTRRNSQGSRPARLPNGYVDLTATASSPPQRRKRDSPDAGPSSKRQKQDSNVDEVDLTEEKQPGQHVKSQDENATQAPAKPEEQPTTFNTFNCVICMDIPTNLTATACGHLFCHTCLMEALIVGETRSRASAPKRSQCPVCRKFIDRNKVGDVIPLLLKKGLATQPRKKKAIASLPAVAPKVH